MFFKLARKNVTRSLKDYWVYFLTLAFGVCIFYVFNSLESQWCMQMLAQKANYMVEGILIFMNVFSAFVSVVLACLVLYANTFLMKRRKRELGTYFLLGLPTGRVSLLLVLETLFIGVIALAAGLALGILLAQGLGLLTIAMFWTYPGDKQFGLVFSAGAVGKTVVYFGVIFLVVMVFTGISVSRAKLIDLMQGHRRNEEMKERPLWSSVLTFLLGAALLGVAYTMLLVRGLLRVDGLFFVMLGLGTLGTLLFFRSLSGFLLRVLKGRKKTYYKGLNMFVLRQFNSRIHSTYLSMTIICLLLLLAIGITACSVGLNNTIESMTVQSCPYDVCIIDYRGAEDGQEPQEISARLAQAGYEAGFREQYTAAVRRNDPAVTGVPSNRTDCVLSLSDHNGLMALQGGAPLDQGDLPTVVEEMLEAGRVSSWIVVDDQTAQGLEMIWQIMGANYQGELQAAEEALQAAVAKREFGQDGGVYVTTRVEVYTETMGSKLLVLFMGLYLGMVFLLTAAAVLALQQLSQAADNVERYQLLSRLGAPDKMCRRALFTQVFLAFFLPLALAVVHSVVGMTAANAVIASVGKVDAVASSIVTAGFILLIYGGYFLATYAGSRRIVGDRT